MKSKFFQLSFFYEKSKWQQIFQNVIKPYLDSQPDIPGYIIYISDFRGDAINFTFFSNNRGLSKRLIGGFVKSVEDYSKINPSKVKKNHQSSNDSFFIDFSYDRFYFGIHQELISNYRKDYEISYGWFQKLLSRIILDEFSIASITEETIISFLLVIFLALDKTIQIALENLQKSYHHLEKMINLNEDASNSRKYSMLQRNVINYIDQLDHIYADEYGAIWWIKELKDAYDTNIKMHAKPDKLHLELVAIVTTQLCLFNGKGAFLAVCMQRHYAAYGHKVI